MQRLPGLQKARQALILVAFGAALGLMCSQVQALDISWTNMAGGYFTNALNWSTQTVPTGTNETAVFTNDSRAAPYTVYFNQYPVTNKSFTVTGGKVIFDLGGGTNYLWGQGSSSVGSPGVAELTITNGAINLLPTLAPWFTLSTIGTIVKVCNNGRFLGATYSANAAGTSLIADGSNAVYDTSAGSYDRISGNITATNGGIARFISILLFVSQGVHSSLEIGSNSLITGGGCLLGGGCNWGYLCRWWDGDRSCMRRRHVKKHWYHGDFYQYQCRGDTGCRRCFFGKLFYVQNS